MSDHSIESRNVRIVTADPSGIGLFGLAVVTLVACTQKLGWTNGVSLVLPWAIFLGAIAQLIASFMDFKHNNTFGATAFGAFGLFWLGTATSWVIKMVPGLNMVSDGHQLGVAFIAYLIFSVYMTILSMETNKVLLIIFILIDLLFLGLVGDSFGWGHWAHSLAAWSELGIAIFSFYGSFACVARAQLGYQLIPLGKPLGLLTQK